MTGGQFGIMVRAGYYIDATYNGAGAVSNTTVRDNTVSETSVVGIAVFTGYVGSTITKTTVEQNEVYANDGDGISAWSQAVNPTTTPPTLVKRHHRPDHPGQPHP